MDFTLLPEHIRDILFSEEYVNLLLLLRKKYGFTKDQEQIFDIFVLDLLNKDIGIPRITDAIRERFGFDDEKSKYLAKDVVLNIVLPFQDYFGDNQDAYRSLGGDPDKDMMQSPIFTALLKKINETFERVLKNRGTIDFEKEAPAMSDLFAHDLVTHFYAPDGEYKVGLNDTILGLLMTQDGYSEKLLEALYENEEKIGDAQLTASDGSAVPPTVANWIKDYLGFAGGTISSISLAKYLTQGAYAAKLPDQDKEALRRLLETFIVLKNFPDSLDKIPEEQWMIIPYRMSREEPKIARQTFPSEKLGVEESKQSVPVEPLKTDVPPSLNAGQALPSTIDYDRVADAVLKNVGATLADDARDRVKKIVVTRVRNVRNPIEAKERLTSPIAEGGAGLLPEIADALLKECVNALQKIGAGAVDEYAPRQTFPSENLGGQAPSLAPSAPSLASIPKMVIKEVDGVPMLVEKKILGTKKKEEQESPIPPTVSQSTAKPVEPLKTDTPSAPSVSSLEPISIPVTVRGTPSAGTAKTPVADIKQPTRLVSVIDEIRALTMKDFRRLSADPAESAKRVLQKIDVLGRESLSKKAEAITAWKESDVYKLYLEVGQVALGHDMGKIAEERKIAGKEYLTEAEFDALLDLNEKLRF